jgi:transcriptional regulator with XRE-family HTH domain
MVVKEQLGQTLVDLRLKAGLTQSEVADAVGLSPRSIQRFEAGQDSPKYVTLFKLAKLFKAHPGELLESAWRQWRKQPDD